MTTPRSSTDALALARQYLTARLTAPAAWQQPGWTLDAVLSDDPEPSIMVILESLDPVPAPARLALIAAASRITVSPRHPAHARMAWAEYAHCARDRRHDDAVAVVRSRRPVLDDPRDSAYRRRVIAIVGINRIKQAIAGRRVACHRSPSAALTGCPTPPISEYHHLLFVECGTTTGATLTSRLLDAMSSPRRVVRWLP